MPGQTTQRKPHLDELDRLRIITALSVVAVHALAFTSPFDHTSLALLTQNGFITAFHFTREVFMFVTALALVYVYGGRPLDTRRFWRRRAVGVLLPYAAWSLIYQVATNHATNALDFLKTLAFNLVTGSASYQLYYILLTIEFYLLLPWFLAWLPRLARHPWVTLGSSFALEVVILFALHDVLPKAPLPGPVIENIALFFDRFAPAYQLYFVMGGLAALNLERFRAFLLRHGAWMVVVGALGLAILEGHYLVDTLARHIAPGAAISVLQPAMAPYSLGAIAFLYWATLWATERARKRDAQRTRRVWSALSDTAFGVYLVHALILTAVMDDVAPHLASWPVVASVTLVWVLTAGASVGVTLILLRIPVVSRLMGRERPAPEWLRTRLRLMTGTARNMIAARLPARSAKAWEVTRQRKGVAGESDQSA